MNFQESTTILNAYAKKKPGNLLNSPRYISDSVINSFIWG